MEVVVKYRNQSAENLVRSDSEDEAGSDFTLLLTEVCRHHIIICPIIKSFSCANNLDSPQLNTGIICQFTKMRMISDSWKEMFNATGKCKNMTIMIENKLHYWSRNFRGFLKRIDF
jgi:hypothetical protein